MSHQTKREILPALNKVISALVALSADCAKLELMDNDQASKRIKRDLAAIKEKELKDFTSLIYGIREELRNKPSRKQINKFNFKKQNNEPESESGTAQLQ